MLKPFYDHRYVEAGCDEAGRGCLAGPVFAAAVILPREFECYELNDSKKLSEKKREELRRIIEIEALSWGVAKVDPDEIDQINILNASFLAMHRAIAQLNPQPEFLLIDGNRFNPYNDIPYECVIKGDSKYMSIAAASILAKTYRDQHMKEASEMFPQYRWDKNKGYPTKFHREAIQEYGVTPLHRRSYKLLSSEESQGSLF